MDSIIHFIELRFSMLLLHDWSSIAFHFTFPRTSVIIPDTFLFFSPMNFNSKSFTGLLSLSLIDQNTKIKDEKSKKNGKIIVQKHKMKRNMCKTLIKPYDVSHSAIFRNKKVVTLAKIFNWNCCSSLLLLFSFFSSLLHFICCMAFAHWTCCSIVNIFNSILFLFVHSNLVELRSTTHAQYLPRKW